MNPAEEWYYAKQAEKEINLLSVTGKQMENGNTLSEEAQQVYNIIKNNNFKMCLQAVWDEVQEDNIYNLSWENVVIFIHDMIIFGVLKTE